jgi:putative oxidoreductase
MTTKTDTAYRADTTGLPRQALTHLTGRALLASLFLVAGYGKLMGWEGNLQYMASAGVPGFLLPAVVALEILGGIALIIGFNVRAVAIALAAFSLGTAAIFHANLSDPIQSIMFFKNLSIAGGLILLTLHPSGAWSVDRRLGA